MTLLYTDPVFLEHDTGAHPENAGRLRAIAERLEQANLVAACEQPAWDAVSTERLTRVHGKPYRDYIEQAAREGGGMLDPDTIVSRRSYEAAVRAAGAACDAVDRVLAGEDATALCLVRPPGHHALPNRAMGFCLFNNIAIAARAAVADHELDRVLVIDWDVHHGNGTQDIFYEDEQIGFFSIHRWPFYPGTGAASETGAGAGLGATRNLPIEYGTPRSEYFDHFRSGLEQFAAKIKPQLVLLSAGFDSHWLDPVGSLSLESEDFAELTNFVRDVAAAHSGGRLVSLLEGGYNPQALAESVELHLRGLLAKGA